VSRRWEPGVDTVAARQAKVGSSARTPVTLNLGSGTAGTVALVKVSEVTRRHLLDEMTVAGINWSGKLEEHDFLARLYDLKAMPSTDGRFDDAYGDIWKHQVMNRDWDDYWVFTDARFNLLYADDDDLLRFLVETLHPVVQPDQDEVARYLEVYNRHLRVDGYEIHVVTDISGKPVFGARSLAAGIPAVEQLRQSSPEIVDHAYLSRQITRIESAIHNDPELAIGSAKELVETVAKTICKSRSITYNNSDDMPALLKKVRAELELTPSNIDAAARGADIVRQLYSNLGSIVQTIAEMRNLYGTGHGKPLGINGLDHRHARLVAGASATLATFLLETHETTRKADAVLSTDGSASK